MQEIIVKNLCKPYKQKIIKKKKDHHIFKRAQKQIRAVI
jgi:hypothetical protein